MATSLATIFLMVGGLIAGRLSARIGPFALLPAVALLLAAWSAGPVSLPGGEVSLSIRQPNAAPIALLILLAISICVAASGSRKHRNTSLIAAGAIASTSALLAHNDIMLAAGIGSSILLCVRNAWAGSEWQENRANSTRVAVSSVLAVLFLISAPILIQTQPPHPHAHLISSAIGLLIVSVTILSGAFPFGGLVPASRDPESRYRWSVSLGCAQLMTLFLTFSIFEGRFEIVELDYWSIAVGVLMVVVSLTAIGSWASSERNAAMDAGRFAITALAISVIMAGGWFAWLGLFAGGAALIVSAVSIQARHYEAKSTSGTLELITQRIVLFATIGFPGSLVFILWWMAVQVALSKDILVAYLLGAAGLLVAISLSLTFERLRLPRSSTDGHVQDIGPSRRWLAAGSRGGERRPGDLPGAFIRNHQRMERVDRHLSLIGQSSRRTVTSSPRFRSKSSAALLR